MKKPTLICVVGPTAIGKTSLGIKLAQEFNAEVISADSRQIYKGMPIGTAAPTAEEKEAAVHHFVEFLTPDKLYSAGDFEKGAIEFLEGYFAERDVAIMVGGSGLYVKGVIEGFDNLPADLEIRTQLNEWLKTEGLNKLQEELKVLDPVHFNKMDNMNPQRVVRALEVCLASKKPFSSFHNQKPQERPFNVIQIGLEAPRDTINERIERRTKLMLEAGWLEETKNLLPYRNENAMNTVGYKELLAHLDGEMSLEDAQERIVISTRQFAKRQMTWFKKDQTIKWFDFNNTHSVVEYVRSLLK